MSLLTRYTNTHTFTYEGNVTFRLELNVTRECCIHINTLDKIAWKYQNTLLREKKTDFNLHSLAI